MYGTREGRTCILILLGERLIPGLVPMLELCISASQDIDGSFVNRPMRERRKMIRDPLPNRHQLYHRDKAHVIRDGQGMSQ